MSFENTEQLNEIEIFGKKVFFINPPYSIRNDVIPALQSKEYEVYIIDSYKDAKNILRKFKESICFINIDAQLSVDAWYNFVKTFEKELVLKSTFIGLISDRIKRDDRALFLSQANVPGGIIATDQPSEQITETIEHILEENKAKGKRKYIRANLNTERDTAMFWTGNDKLFQMKLLDISSVGMSVRIPAQMTSFAQEKSLLRDITLRLGTKQFVVDAVVFAIKKDGANTTWIMLLHQNTPSQVRDSIRKLVAETNQKLLMASINNTTPDSTDYSSIPYYNLVAKRHHSE